MIGILWAFHLAAPGAMTARPPGALQVPYVAQSEQLCGGATIAMVERWWGRRGVYAEEFAHLMSPALGGILTTDLTTAVAARGWRTDVIRGTADQVKASLRGSVPVIALIQVGTDRYHYVVIVGWDDAQVVYHDPAVRPFVTLATDRFLARWHGTDFWGLLIRPALQPRLPPRVAPDSLVATPLDSLPCRPWLDLAVDAAIADQLGKAEALLARAGDVCPEEPVVLRELAGIRFRQGQHAVAARLAEEYLQRVPDDSLGWQLVASSRYRAGESVGALEAWNRIGRPRIDLVRVDGSEHVRYRAIVDALGMAPGTTLTAGQMAIARRRIADLPALALTQLGYEAVRGGVVEVHATVVERPVLAPLPRQLVIGAARALLRHEAGVSVASPLGAGEVWTGQWRWEAANPRRALRLEIPVRIGWPGVISLEGSRDGYRFAPTTPTAPPLLAQRGATTLGFSSWVGGNLEALLGTRLERWSAEGSFLSLSVGAARHALQDRLIVTAQAERAAGLSMHPGYSRFQFDAGWKSPPSIARVTWSARVGTDWISQGSPRGLWPIAGGDLGRAIPLRAHPLIIDHMLPTARSGQGVVHGGVTADKQLATIGLVTVGAGLFLDGADVITTEAGKSLHRRFLDGGTGLRIGLLSATAMALRIDLARGVLADRRWGVTIGLERPWPHRPRPLQ